MFSFFLSSLSVMKSHLYEEHKSFSIFLMPNNVKDLSKYLPNDLIEKDRDKIERFIDLMEISPTTIIHFKFYKNGKKTRLSGIYCEKKDEKIKNEIKTKESDPEVKFVKKACSAYRQKEKSVEGNKYSVISVMEDKIHELDENFHKKTQVQEIFKIINLSLDQNNEEREFKKSINITYSNKQGKKQIIAMQLLWKGKKENFYILTTCGADSRLLIVNERGHTIPGKLLNITDQLPVRNGIKGSPIGYRNDPFLKVRKLHTGQDIKAPAGSEIFSMAEGTVVFADYHRTYGYVVLIYHGSKAGEGYTTLYGHCSKLIVKSGQKVGKGQLIAYVGSTGRSTGPHIHLEVIDNKTKQRLDPRNTFSLSIYKIPSFFISDFLKQKQLVSKILKK